MGKQIIALDAMGGDHGAPVTVGAAKLALDELPEVELVLLVLACALKDLKPGEQLVGDESGCLWFWFEKPGVL